MPVTLNGRILENQPHDPVLRLGTKRDRVPVDINGQIASGISINGYEYPPAPAGAVFYLPGLPGQGTTIWDRSAGGNHGTLVGATWKRSVGGLYYPSFDGDDYILKTVANFRSGDSAGTIGLWFKATTSAGSQWLFGTSDEASGTKYYFGLTIRTASNVLGVAQKNDDVADLVLGSTTVTDLKWHSTLLVSIGTAWIIYLDGIAESLSISSGANSGDWFADTPNRDNFTFGCLKDTSILNYLASGGGIALPFVSTEQFTASMALNWHNQTRGLSGV